jgi:acetoacetyl-[acyl-carrier protein] synthase
MLRLPIMVAAGGVNSAGRTSRRHAYKRMIWDSLSAAERSTTQRALGQMMGATDPNAIANHTFGARNRAGMV